MIRRPARVNVQCKRFALRTVLIGDTVFVFDSNGICNMKPAYHPRFWYDYDNLLKLNGVKNLDKEKENPVKIKTVEEIKVEEEDKLLDAILAGTATFEEPKVENIKEENLMPIPKKKPGRPKKQKKEEKGE